MPDEPTGNRDRLEREIEEILGKIEEFPSASQRRARQRQRTMNQLGASISARQRGFLAWLSAIDMSQVMLLSFFLILLSFFMRGLSPLIMQWVLYAGIVLFISAFAMMVFGRRGGAREQQYWRGKPIQYRQSSVGDLFRRWFGSRGSKR